MKRKTKKVLARSLREFNELIKAHKEAEKKDKVVMGWAYLWGNEIKAAETKSDGTITQAPCTIHIKAADWKKIKGGR
jgi:hypothetical protein